MKKKEIVYIALGAALAVAGMLWWKLSSKEEKPPKDAPQVPIENPGEQSEFTTAASESDLG